MRKSNHIRYMTFKRRFYFYLKYLLAGLWLGILLGIVFIWAPQAKAKLIDPTATSGDREIIVSQPGQDGKAVGKPAPTPKLSVDELIDKYAKFYGKTSGGYHYTKQLLHCMIYRESAYGDNKGHGDGGLAGGPMQFHEGTWVGFRKLMGKEVGSRYDLAQSIETAAWAINTGRKNAWGPVLRKECE